MNNSNTYNQEQFGRIENYLLGKMNSTERVQFEAEINRDDKLKQQVEEVRALISAVKEESLKGELEEIHANLGFEKTEKAHQQRRKFNYLAIAATIALLISVGGFWYMNSASGNQRLFQEYFEPDPGLPLKMGNNDKHNFYEAMVDYKRGNYDSSIEQWEKQRGFQTKNDTLTYFLGVAYLANKQTKKAIPLLNLVVKDSTSYFYNDALYYLGLAYLETDQPEQAKRLLLKSEIENANEVAKKIK